MAKYHHVLTIVRCFFNQSVANSKVRRRNQSKPILKDCYEKPQVRSDSSICLTSLDKLDGAITNTGFCLNACFILQSTIPLSFWKLSL